MPKNNLRKNEESKKLGAYSKLISENEAQSSPWLNKSFDA